LTPIQARGNTLGKADAEPDAMPMPMPMSASTASRRTDSGERTLQRLLEHRTWHFGVTSESTRPQCLLEHRTWHFGVTSESTRPLSDLSKTHPIVCS
jgi:hypothetical protein